MWRRSVKIGRACDLARDICTALLSFRVMQNPDFFESACEYVTGDIDGLLYQIN